MIITYKFNDGTDPVVSLPYESKGLLLFHLSKLMIEIADKAYAEGGVDIRLKIEKEKK